MALLALAATAVLTLLGSHSVATFVLSKAPATWPDKSIPPLLLAIAMSVCVLSTTQMGSNNFHGQSPPTKAMRFEEEPASGDTEAVSALAASGRLKEDVRRLHMEVVALRIELDSKKEHSDLKDTQIQTLTGWNMDSQADWSRTKSALEDANRTLRQTLAEQTKLIERMENRIVRLEEECDFKELEVRALAGNCASKQRQIKSLLNQAIIEHEQTRASTDKYEQTVAELNDKLEEYSRALVGTGLHPPSVKLLPTQRWPLVPCDPRRPATSDT